MKKNGRENQGNGIMDKMGQILKNLKEGKTVTLEELQSAGFILVVDKDFGRMIDKPHLKKLKASHPYRT